MGITKAPKTQEKDGLETKVGVTKAPKTQEKDGVHVQEAGRIPGRTAGFGASETWLSLSAGTGPFMGKPGGARGAWGHHTWGRDDQLPSFQPRGILGHLPCQTPGIHPWVGKVLWRRKWQPTTVLLPGKSHGRRSLVGYSLRGCRVGHD